MMLPDASRMSRNATTIRSPSVKSRAGRITSARVDGSLFHVSSSAQYGTRWRVTVSSSTTGAPGARDPPIFVMGGIEVGSRSIPGTNVMISEPGLKPSLRFQSVGSIGTPETFDGSSSPVKCSRRPVGELRSATVKKLSGNGNKHSDESSGSQPAAAGGTGASPCPPGAPGTLPWRAPAGAIATTHAATTTAHTSATRDTRHNLRSAQRSCDRRSYGRAPNLAIHPCPPLTRIRNRPRPGLEVGRLDPSTRRRSPYQPPRHGTPPPAHIMIAAHRRESRPTRRWPHTHHPPKRSNPGSLFRRPETRVEAPEAPTDACWRAIEHLFIACGAMNRITPEEVENRRRSIAMLTPGSPALNREEALTILAELGDALHRLRGTPETREPRT